ncbi:MAG: WecB/TagA/CpsF family glycosyltransferase [Patescibacteria group bacterium]
MNTKNVLGIKISNVELHEANEIARQFLYSTNQHKIFTPNPEMLVKAHKDEYFKTVLNAGDLNLCDGFGLRVFSGVPRIPGVDFMLELCALAEKENKSIYLLGSGSDEVIKQCAEALNKKFVHLKIVGLDRGPIITENDKFPMSNFQSAEDGVLQKINATHPDILFVAFGMGKQEKWIYENLAKMLGVKIAMGVGGSFDYIAGTVPRAPLFLRKIGLEWMYRLFRQPCRLRRIFNATFKFVYLIICHRS